MKVLSDFDGVLTDLAHEAARVDEIFRYEFQKLFGNDTARANEILDRAEAAMVAEPHANGWVYDGRITAHCNEDGFIRANARGALLDRWVKQGERGLADLKPQFTELAFNSYSAMVKETAAGKLKPVDPSTRPVLEALMDRGAEIVVVSNSGTERICQILASAGLKPEAHESGRAGPLRVRGNANKFHLGEGSRPLSIGDYTVETVRPNYEKIIREEKPDVVIGDVFSLDLALPFRLAKEEPEFRNLKVVMRGRPYSPAWSKQFLLGNEVREVKRGVFDRLDQLLELA